MSNSYYGYEIAAKIAVHLSKDSEQVALIEHAIKDEHGDCSDIIASMSADATRVFDTIEDLSGELFVDWPKALDLYADEILKHLLKGWKPSIVELISMAARSIEKTLPEDTEEQRKQRSCSIH